MPIAGYTLGSDLPPWVMLLPTIATCSLSESIHDGMANTIASWRAFSQMLPMMFNDLQPRSSMLFDGSPSRWLAMMRTGPDSIDRFGPLDPMLLLTIQES